MDSKQATLELKRQIAKVLEMLEEVTLRSKDMAPMADALGLPGIILPVVRLEKSAKALWNEAELVKHALEGLEPTKPSNSNPDEPASTP